MAFKVLEHVPLGGQGKTFKSSNLAMGLAERGYTVLLCGCCFSNQMTLFFNGEEGLILDIEKQFLFEVPGLDSFVEGTPLDDLLLEVRPNLHFLPGGNVAEADYLLRLEASKRLNKTPVAVLEDLLSPWEKYYDFMVFDTAPNHNTNLFFNLLYYADTVIATVEPEKRGQALLKLFIRYLDVKNPDYREKFGKSPINVTLITPNRHKTNVGLHNRTVRELVDEFDGLVTDSIQECASVGRAWSEGKSLREYTDELSRKLRKNEQNSLQVVESITDTVIEQAKKGGFIQ